MPQRPNPESGLRAAVSVSQMARMLGISRAALYSHIARGTFLPPIYQTATRRPIYTRDMQARNLEAKVTQLGVNGEFVLFYERRPREAVGNSTRRSREAGNAAGALQGRLAALGMGNVSESQVGAALAACFPHGTADLQESEVLRVIYRHLRRSHGV